MSSSKESVLALENLQLKGYRGGPRLDLDEPHLLLMTKVLAEYHALSFAMKLKQPETFKKLVKNIIPLPFLPGDGETSNLYTVVYGVGVRRFLMYVDKIASKCSATFIKDTNNLKSKYGDNPAAIMESFRRADETFSIILHGDFNRNNVLFRYDSADGYDNPKDIKMIDFQVNNYIVIY